MATISLCLIAKNEAHNLPILAESIGDCFDEVILVDTGSTDNTVEIAKSHGFKVFHFDWVYNFSKARNFSFSKATSDFVMWMDLDDSLSDKEAFKNWKSSMMGLADYWLVNYHYAFDGEKPVCTFARERVVRNNRGFQWKYFVHEGIVVPDPKVTQLFVTTWTINHRRTAEDLAKDKGRNLGIFERNLDNLDARMRYYFGKELFENGKAKEGYTHLLDAAKDASLDRFDRILALQYAASAAIQCGQFQEAIDIAIRGLQIDPLRAEYFATIGDAYLGQGRLLESVPYYEAATHCPPPKQGAIQPIFKSEVAYSLWPRMQLSRVYFQMGMLAKAKEVIQAAKQLGAHPDLDQIESELCRVEIATKPAELTQGDNTEDIVITCPPNLPYAWDDEIYKSYGCGGSETAAIEMARHLHNLTKRRVIIFNSVAHEKEYDGVVYRPSASLPEYFNQFIPKVHIAWRHTERVTYAPTYVWCHDLFAMGIEDHSRYDFVLALSEFHKNYLMTLFGVPENKIIVTRNGIEPKRWDRPKKEKKNVVVWPSSPDRGIERALHVMDLVREEIPDVEFKAFYGFDNMMKAGKSEQVYYFQSLFNQRPWATMVGNVAQDRLIDELLEAKVWLYPTNFLETFCITALECALSGVYPVVRRHGALPHTLKNIPCDLIDRDCETVADVRYYAERVVAAIKEDKWKSLNLLSGGYSWESVAKEWSVFMNLLT